MAKRKRSKKQYIKLLTQYGFQIWAILIVANAALVYMYQFSTHAQQNTTNQIIHSLSISQSPSGSALPATSTTPPISLSPSPSTAPLGPTLNLAFSVPGIGSGGGTMKPLHPTRNVTVYLYAQTVNSQDPAVKPLYTVQGTATFDTNPASPTYTSFINPLFDLGSSVQEGSYQITFKTDLSLRTLIKANPTDLGGEIFDISQGQNIQIPLQTVLMGDIIPAQGDNSIDINDYNAFINCYGPKDTSTFCKGHNYGDFNDDGVIDGIDYNILLRSLNVLAQEGLPVPQITPTIQPVRRITRLLYPITPTKAFIKSTATASKGATTQHKGSGGSAGLVVLLLLFFIIILFGTVGFVLYIKNETVRTLIQSLIHRLQTTTPPPAEEEIEKTDENTNEEIEEVEETPAPTPPAATPVGNKTTNAIEKDCYIKTKGKDETGTGMWLLLTDDNGSINAHYAKTDAVDGFAKVKGVMKTENGKTFLEISDLAAEG